MEAITIHKHLIPPLCLVFCPTMAHSRHSVVLGDGELIKSANTDNEYAYMCAWGVCNRDEAEDAEQAGSGLFDSAAHCAWEWGKLGDVYQERQAGTGCSPHHSDISGAHTRVSPLKCRTHSLTKSQIGFLIMKPPLVFLHSSAATRGVWHTHSCSLNTLQAFCICFTLMRRVLPPFTGLSSFEKDDLIKAAY